MYLYDRNMVINTKLKYAYSISNYRQNDVTKVVCARHVMKRPNKRSALVFK